MQDMQLCFLQSGKIGFDCVYRDVILGHSDLKKYSSLLLHAILKKNQTLLWFLKILKKSTKQENSSIHE